MLKDIKDIIINKRNKIFMTRIRVKKILVPKYLNELTQIIFECYFDEWEMEEFCFYRVYNYQN